MWHTFVFDAGALLRTIGPATVRPRNRQTSRNCFFGRTKK